MKITKKEVEHVATLARLRLTEEETELYTKQLDNILSYIDKLNELDTTGIEPATHSMPITTPLREDEVKTSLTQEDALMNAPDRENGCFKVPKIIEGG